MKRIQVVAALALLATLLGCAREVGPDFRLDRNSKSGVAAISLMASGDIRGEVLFYWRPANDGNTLRARSLQWAPRSNPLDWPYNAKRPIPGASPAGRLAILELAPGQYEFYQWQQAYGGMIYKFGRPFAARFEVVAGQVTYVGSLHVTVRGNQFSIAAEDRRQRDLALLAQKLPNVPPESVVVRLIAEVDPTKQ
jgi:hypothetical protein